MKLPRSRVHPENRLTRRAAVKLAGLGAAGAALGGTAAAVLTHAGRADPPEWRFFSPSEATLLTALCEELIPRDQDPGATDVGVVRYIDRQLAGPLARHRTSYRAGLEAFRGVCFAETSNRFEDLSSDRKIDLLRRVEAGTIPAERWREPAPGPREFFRLILGHTLQGFYGPARHGGNRGHASYAMLGLDYPQIIGRNRNGKESR